MNKQIKFQQEITDLFKEMQKEIVQTVLFSDPNASFKEDLWNRETEETTEAGGGITKTITNGTVFEKAGVNFSEVYGPISKELTEILPGAKVGTEFYATGTSVVLHPYSPKVPTVHCNFRYMNAGEFSWFGGGMDLTPYVLSEDDFRYFHQILKNTCDKHDLSYYPKFKKSCDEYFYLAHRKETRGIGGIFFDYLGKDQPTKLPNLFSFISDLTKTFNQAYFPIVEKRKSEKFSEEEKNFQLLRRGRYVEFNLLYDRGTKFGLKSNGRVESILMSLPPHATWDYNVTHKSGSFESILTEIFKSPRNWIEEVMPDYSKQNSDDAPSLNVG